MSSVPKPAVAAILAARGALPPSQRDRGRRALARERADVLSSVPLFAGLSKRHLRKLADDAREIDVPAGDVIVRADQRGQGFFVILEGRAKVVGSTGRALGRLGTGDHFGELALLDGGPRTASVVAETDLVAMRLPRATFREMLRTEAGVAAKLLETLASIIRTQSVLSE
jgi:CRP-like cAMP-binding protein